MGMNQVRLARVQSLPVSLEKDMIYFVQTGSGTCRIVVTDNAGSPTGYNAGLNPRGAYSGATAYAFGDTVSYAGATWILIAPSSTGHAPPTLPTISNAYWALLAQPGGTPKAQGDYSNDTAYSALDVVTHDGSSWIYINATPGSGHAPPELPATENAYWRLVAAAGADGESFAPGGRGPFSDRALFDDEDMGFAYLSIDGDGDDITTAVLFFKESAASGDWGPPTPFGTSDYNQLINTPTFETLDLVSSKSIAAPMVYFETAGRSVAGEGGALYIRAASEPSHAGKIQSADGSWWELGKQTVDQYMFGAVGNGTTDDTTALANLHAYCEATGAIYKYQPGTHKITSTLTIKSSGDASAATIQGDSSAFSPMVLVGTKTTGAYIAKYKILLPNVINSAKTGTGWSGFQTGVELSNLSGCDIWFPIIKGFAKGLRCSGYTEGFSYNRVGGLWLWNNKVGHSCQPGDDNGWVNENYFDIWRFVIDSSEGTAVSGVRHLECVESSASAVNGPPNNNVWMKPSLEGNVPERVAYIQGSSNQIIQARYEATTPTVEFYSRTSAQTSSNVFNGGYNAHNITWVFSGSASVANNLYHPRHNVFESNSGDNIVLSNSGSSTISGAHLKGYGAGSTPLAKASSATDWGYILYAQGLAGKAAADANPRCIINFTNGRWYCGNGTVSPTNYIGAFGTSIGWHGDLLPDTDNTYNLGLASFRVKEIFAGNATINTSDAREKDWRGQLNESELRVSKRLSKLIGIYRWLEAIGKKGDAARLHAGVRAQDVITAFEAEGLDAMAYGVCCYDEWDEMEPELSENGDELHPGHPAGNRYGIRADELWAFVAAGFEARLAALETL